jgi:hypothetical protein
MAQNKVYRNSTCPSKILAGRPEHKRPLGRPRRKWEDNIRMDLKGRSMDSSGLAWGPVASSCEHGNEFSGFIKVTKFFDPLSDC